MNVSQIRAELKRLYQEQDFVTDKSGGQMVEIVNATFVADEDLIFGEPNMDYVERELAWYNSMSRNVNDIPGGTPAIWKQVATPSGMINSNYGWCIYSEDNHDQYLNAVSELVRNKESRRAIMIYTRPSMQLDYNFEGMSDFMCTNTVQYFIRKNKLVTIVSMRSNDAVFGYKNDYHWQLHVRDRFLDELKLMTYPELEAGEIFWNAGSLHVYPRHFKFLEA